MFFRFSIARFGDAVKGIFSLNAANTKNKAPAGRHLCRFEAKKGEDTILASRDQGFLTTQCGWETAPTGPGLPTAEA